MVDAQLRQSGNSIIYISGFCSLAGYCFISYDTARHQSIPLIISYLILFGLYLAIYHYTRNASQLKVVVAMSILFRVALLFALPNLSDDFYRFIWDGRLILQGIHPFAELPSYFIQNNIIHLDSYDYFLYTQMNSAEYFTIYPPVCQLVFLLAAYLSSDSLMGSVIIMRLIIIAAELGSLFFMLKLLKNFSMPRKQVLLYALNPLVILELSNNLHFEALMIFFLLANIYFLQKNKLIVAALFFSLSIGTKLIPLIFLPLLISRIGFKKSLLFYAIVGLATVALFLPFLSESLIHGFSTSLSLYFQKFEFNASIYYLLREIGFSIKGYNIIATAGKAMALCTFLGIILFSYWERDKKIELPEAFLWTWCIYLLFTTTLHPWYIIPLLAFCPFTRYRFPVLWAVLIFLTYAGYTTDGYDEQLWWVIIEYIAVFGFCIYEIISIRKKEQLFSAKY